MGSSTYSTRDKSGSSIVPRPLAERHWPVHFQSDDGNTGEVAYPINYAEVYHLKGRLLTLVDATFTDPEQRKAFKDMVWNTLRGWIEDVAESGGDANSVDLKVSHARAGDRENQ